MSANFFKIKNGIALGGPLTSDPSSPVNGDIYYNSSTNKFRKYENGAWSDLAGASSTYYPNLISVNDSSFENNSVNNWARYQDTAQFEPVDGTGGSPSANLTFAATASSPLNGVYSALLTKSGSANMQGYGVSLSSLAVPLELRGQNLSLDFFYDVASGTYTSSDLIVRIYDQTNGALISSNTEALQSTASGVSGRFIASFNCPVLCSSLRVIVHQASTTTNNYTIAFDDFTLWSVLSLPGNAGVVAPTAEYKFRQASGYGSTNNHSYYFANTDISNDVTGLLSIPNNSTFGSVITANRRCRVTVTATDNFSLAREFGVTINASLTTDLASLAQSFVTTRSRTSGSDQQSSVTVTRILQPGEYLNFQNNLNTAGATPEQVQLYVFAEEVAPTLSLGGSTSSTLPYAHYSYYNGLNRASTNTAIPYYSGTNPSQDTSGLVSVDNSTTLGFSVTALKPCTVSMQFSMGYNGTDYMGISLNSTQLSTSLDSITQADQVYKVFNNASNQVRTVVATVTMKVGDVLRPHLSTSQTPNGYTMYVNAVSIDIPVSSGSGVNAQVSEWTRVNAPTITSTGASPTKGTTQKDFYEWRRVGGDLEVRYSFIQSGAGSAGSGQYLFNLIPSGLQIDLTQGISVADGWESGWGGGYVQGAQVTGTAVVSVQDATTVRINALGSTIGNGTNGLNNANQEISVFFSVPIVGWTAVFASGSGSTNVVSKSSNYTMSDYDGLILVDTTSAFTLTIPAASSNNRNKIFRIKKTSSDFNSLTISGGLTDRLDTIGECVEIINDGTTWTLLERTGISGVLVSTAVARISASSTNPTKGTLNQDIASWYREGSQLRCFFNYDQTSSGADGSGVYLVDAVPNGSSLTVDTARIAIGNGNADINLGVCGPAYAMWNNTTWLRAIAFYAVSGGKPGISIGWDGATVWGSGGAQGGLGNNNVIQFSAEWVVPITGWKGA